jgi:hypothetical protein
MKDVLKCDLDIARIFTHFGRVVASKRAKELEISNEYTVGVLRVVDGKL